MEVNHLVLFIPPDLPVDDLPVPLGQGRPADYSWTERAVRGPVSTGDYTGHHQVEMTVASLLTSPQQLDLSYTGLELSVT